MVVFYCFFLVSVSVTFHLMYVHIVLVLSTILSGHFLERPARSVDPMFCL